VSAAGKRLPGGHVLARYRSAVLGALLIQLSIPGLLPAESSSLSIREGHVDAGNGVWLFYRLFGTGRDTLVIIHGGPGFSSAYFGHDLDALVGTGRGHALLFYDQRGAGQSTLVKDSVGLSALRFVEDLEAVRRHFKFEKMTMLGHSWGAGVMALYAAQHPRRVGRMVSVGGIPLTARGLAVFFDGVQAGRDSASIQRMSQWEATLKANPEDQTACRELKALYFTPFFVDTTGATLQRVNFCSDPPASRRNALVVSRYTWASLGAYDWRPAMKQVTAPTLIIHGDREVIPMEYAREWAATMPNGRLLIMRGLGHFLYVEDPARFFSAVDAFLAGGWPSETSSR
jgi:proline iminopeptidase